MNFFFQFLKFLNLIEFYFKLILIFHYPAIFKFLKKLVKCCAEIQFEIQFQSFKRFVVDVWRSRDLRLPASNCTPQLQSPRSLKRLCCIYIFIILIGLLFSRRLVICLSGRQKIQIESYPLNTKKKANDIPKRLVTTRFNWYSNKCYWCNVFSCSHVTSFRCVAIGSLCWVYFLTRTSVGFQTFFKSRPDCDMDGLCDAHGPTSNHFPLRKKKINEFENSLKQKINPIFIEKCWFLPD